MPIARLHSLGIRGLDFNAFKVMRLFYRKASGAETVIYMQQWKRRILFPRIPLDLLCATH